VPQATRVLLFVVAVTKVTSFSNTSHYLSILRFYKDKIEKVVTFVTFPDGILEILVQEQQQWSLREMMPRCRFGTRPMTFCPIFLPKDERQGESPGKEWIIRRSQSHSYEGNLV
jgi:hypothetical protein